jgi:signal transduction histidine kinase
MEHIFEAFFSTKPQGMSLGLAICRTIIDAHKGQLWAANNRERGASFYFTLPVNSGATA